MTLLLPQPLVTASVYVTVVVPQPSVAVAAPVAVGAVLAPHSIVRFTGDAMMGGWVSRTMMVWMQVELLPHWSVARQVREITLVPAVQPLLTESLRVTATPPPPSEGVAT